MAATNETVFESLRQTFESDTMEVDGVEVSTSQPGQTDDTMALPR